MGRLRDQMDADLQLKGFAPSTRREYLRRARQFAEHYGRSPAALGEAEIRAYLLYLVNDKRVRLSLAPFNNETDVDAALEAIEHLATRGLPPGAMTAQQFKDTVLEEDD